MRWVPVSGRLHLVTFVATKALVRMAERIARGYAGGWEMEEAVACRNCASASVIRASLSKSLDTTFRACRLSGLVVGLHLPILYARNCEKAP